MRKEVRNTYFGGNIAARLLCLCLNGVSIYLLDQIKREDKEQYGVHEKLGLTAAIFLSLLELSTLGLILFVAVSRGFYGKLGKHPTCVALGIMVAEFIGILMSLITVPQTATKKYGPDKEVKVYGPGQLQGLVVGVYIVKGQLFSAFTLFARRKGQGD